MVLADMLSRYPSCRNNTPIELHQNIQTMHFNSECLNIIRGVTERDLVHSTLYRLTLNRWPEKIKTVPCIAHHFWGTRDELTVEDGILVSPELHDRTPHELHDSHQSIEKMTHIARSNVYWPGIDAEIADYVRCCTICAKHKALQTVQPMLPHDIPDGPWQELAPNYFTHSNKDYLLIADS